MSIRTVKASCRKCGETFDLNIGENSREEVENLLRQQRTVNCPGQHVELSGPLDYWELHWDQVGEREEPPSDEEYGQKLVEEKGRENVFYMGDKSIGELLRIPSLHEIKGLDHMGFGEFADAQHWYTRYDSPKGTTRFYVRSAR